MRLSILSLVLLSSIATFDLAAESTAKDLEALGIKVKYRQDVIAELSIDCDKLSDDDYHAIAGHTAVTRISISGKNFADHHLAALAPMVAIENFSINGTQLTDDGYRHFAQFPKLRTLALWHPSRNQESFTGRGLRHLKKLPELTSLTFAGATTGDTAMAAIASLPQLTSYRQWHNCESAEGLKQLAKLTNLTKLTIGQRLPSKTNPDASFTGTTIPDLLPLVNLEEITLQEARLSFDELAKLRELPKLKIVGLKKIDVSKADVDKFKNAFPDIELRYEPLSAEEAEQLLGKKLKL